MAATCHGAGCIPSRPHPRRELRLCHPTPTANTFSLAHTPRLHLHQVIVVRVDALQAVGVGIPRRCRPSAQTAPRDGARCGASAAALGSVLAERLAPTRSHPALAAAGLGKLGMARCPMPAQPQPFTVLLRAGGGQEPELGVKKLKRTHLQADRLLQRPPKGCCFALRAAASGSASYEAQHVLHVVRVTLAVLGCIRHTARLQVREDQCKVAPSASQTPPTY